MKTKIYFLSSVVLLLISISLFTSCSSELKNEEATSLISKMPNEVITGNITIMLAGSSYKEKQTIDDFYAANARLIKRGILTEPKTYKEQISYDLIRYNITSDLTDSAKALLLDGGSGANNGKRYTVKCGELKFVEVVRVFQEDESKTSEIEYKAVFIPTMFADFATMNSKYEQGKTYSKKRIAKKYDVGWRLEN